MIFTEAPDLELLAEKLISDAFYFRDEPSFKTLTAVLETTSEVAKYLKEREEALQWSSRQLCR
ncbi:MAG: hypothetical protein OWR52_04700 [Acidibacillus sp.]|uniref:Uncharacterized protein n=1 Tax=Sulfoacidibacillus ferrooxidans TaxID=2005001 RepID=A0A9X1V5V9_9BACL|nr:hypothetical protein [Sulfoacidibacillus ferrooxidans]MCI0181908.1 hypothetical protein [Sulfoacidibacillus ferrooxidans]MCY0892796.1 hypothetical protein [Acidibacillus sp.]